MPMTALRLAPSQYTWPPFPWTILAISTMCSSKIPRVFGFVIMMAATSSSITSATAAGSTTPCAPDFTGTTW